MGKKIDKLKEKLKNLKNKEIIIAAVAVIVMLVVYFAGGTGKSTGTQSETLAGSDYRVETETKLREAIVRLSGDKNV